MHAQLRCMPQKEYITAVINSNLKEKLKPYPQPSRSETLANQEREEIGSKEEVELWEVGSWQGQ